MKYCLRILFNSIVIFWNVMYLPGLTYLAICGMYSKWRLSEQQGKLSWRWILFWSIYRNFFIAFYSHSFLSCYYILWYQIGNDMWPWFFYFYAVIISHPCGYFFIAFRSFLHTLTVIFSYINGYSYTA